MRAEAEVQIQNNNWLARVQGQLACLGHLRLKSIWRVRYLQSHGLRVIFGDRGRDGTGGEAEDCVAEVDLVVKDRQ